MLVIKTDLTIYIKQEDVEFDCNLHLVSILLGIFEAMAVPLTDSAKWRTLNSSNIFKNNDYFSIYIKQSGV